MLHAVDGGRVKMVRTCSVDGARLETKDLSKAYETETGRVVIMSDEDFEGLPVPGVKEISVLEFVPSDQVDPMLFDRSYYLEPEARALKPYVLLREALRTPTFRWFYLATVLASPVMFIPFAHLSASARDLGLQEAQAVGLVGLIGVGSLVGRFSIGLLADRLGRARTLVLMQLSMCLSYLLWAAAGGYPLLALYALWFGLSYGSIVSLLPAICMDCFGGRSVASVVGALYSGAAVGNLLGPVLAGAAFDHLGHYQGVMGACLVLALLATWSSWRMHQTGRAQF